MAAVTAEILAERVAIALDVLEQLRRETNPLRAQRGAYIVGSIKQPEAADPDLQDAIDEVQQNCQVCLKGGLFLSYARLRDNVKLLPLGRPSLYWGGQFRVNAAGWRLMDVLTPIFGMDYLDEMERFFERSYEEPRVVLERLMQQIVDDGGASPFDEELDGE